MSQRTFEELLACMRAAAGSDAEALALVASFGGTATVIELSLEGEGKMLRTDPTFNNPSRVLLLYPLGLEVSPVGSDEGDEKPIAFVEEIEFGGAVKLDAIHLLGDECAPEWLGLQLILAWFHLLAALENEELRREYERAVALADSHGASGIAIKRQVDTAQREVERMAQKAGRQLFHLAARLLDAKLEGTLTRIVAEAPSHMSEERLGTWIANTVHWKIMDSPTVLSERDEDTRDYVLNLALNWFARREPKSAPRMGTLC